MKFLKGFLVFLLIAIIIGGIGYIGYSYLFMGNMNHSSTNGTTANAVTESQSQQASDSKTNQNDQSMSGMAGMENSSTDQQSNPNNSSQQSNNQLALNQANLLLQNKDKLDKTAALINEALKLMSVDPYAPSDSNSGMNMQMQENSNSAQPAQNSTSAATDSGNSTTINVYPQENRSGSSTMTQNSTMQNMGTTYDSNKMDKLHSGLYKIAIGTALIDQLKNDLTYQAENAAGNYQDAVQYYSNQYNLTVQNKNKLNQIITYLDEAATLVNINPYVSTNGLVYDKDRMSQIHQSIQKLAEGVVTLNSLSDDLTKQTISLTNTVQNYNNNANQQMNNSSMSMPMSSDLFGGLFDNISMANVVNIILILFVIGLVFGILGFIFSLLKSPAQKVTKNEEKLTTNS